MEKYDDVMKKIKVMCTKTTKIYIVLLAMCYVAFVLVLVLGASMKVLLLIAMACVVYTFVSWLIITLRWTSTKERIGKLLEQMNSPDKEQLLKEFKEAPVVQWKKGCFVSSKFIFFSNTRGVFVLPIDQVLWAYRRVDTFIPLYKYYSMYMLTMDQTRYVYEAGMSAIWSGEEMEDRVEDAIWMMKRSYPGILTGYSRDLYLLFRENFELMKQRYQERQRMP